MEVTMFRCLYQILLFAGGGYVFFSFLVSEVVDWGEEMMEGIGNAAESLLENLFDTLGMEVDLDFLHSDINIEKGPGPFSFRTLLFFGTGFGAGGLFGYALGWPDIFTLIPAFGTGLVLAALAYLILRLMWSGQGTTNIDRTDYVGLSGIVNITIPEGGLGQISTTFKLQKKLLPAKSHDGKQISSGSTIFVTEINEGGICMVKKD